MQHALDTYAELAFEESLTHRSTRLAGAAARLRHAMGMLSWRSGVVAKNGCSVCAGTLGEQAFRLAWDEGDAMTSDQEIAYALESDD